MPSLLILSKIIFFVVEDQELICKLFVGSTTIAPKIIVKNFKEISENTRIKLN